MRLHKDFGPIVIYWVNTSYHLDLSIILFCPNSRPLICDMMSWQVSISKVKFTKYWVIGIIQFNVMSVDISFRSGAIFFKRTPTFINFLNFFQGLQSYCELIRLKFCYISLHILRSYVYSFLSNFPEATFIQGATFILDFRVVENTLSYSILRRKPPGHAYIES